MVIRRMSSADAGEVSALIVRSYDRVLVHYHSPELIEQFREHATPESLVEQLGCKDVYVVDDGGRIVATGGLGWFDTESEDPADRRVTNLFVAVDLLGKGIGRTLLDHLIRLADAEGACRVHVASSRNAVSFYTRAGFRPDPDTPSARPEITWMVMRL